MRLRASVRLYTARRSQNRPVNHEQGLMRGRRRQRHCRSYWPLRGCQAPRPHDLEALMYLLHNHPLIRFVVVLRTALDNTRPHIRIRHRHALLFVATRDTRGYTERTRPGAGGWRNSDYDGYTMMVSGARLGEQCEPRTAYSTSAWL